jgi:superfamily II DNA or RNA helicase
LRVPLDSDEKDISIQELYTEIMDNDFRNQQITEDVLKNYHQGRNCIVLSLRTAHVELLVKKLKEKVPDVIKLMGGMGKKSTQKAFQCLTNIPADKNIILVATGHFIGEGFDEPRLDTLFLAMPISWKGTLQQYAGRLHRLFKTKKEVRIYDYVDIQDFTPKDHAALQRTLNLLTSNGVSVVFKSNIHQKFAIMDQKVVWYGSINLLSYGSAQESIMRIEGSNIANELMKSIDGA